MNSIKKTIQLLLVEDSQNEAERIANLFRASGCATRVQRIDCLEELEQVLKQSWDLLICASDCKSLTPAQVIALLRERARDIPLIQLLGESNAESNSAAISAALEQGARVVLPRGEDRRLLLVSQRELTSLEDRRALQSTREALREVEKRCLLLLESSVDAIAYLHDGVHCYTNQAWLQRFGYDSVDELEGMPVIDLIAPADQDKFKAFFREGKAGQSDGVALSLNCFKQNGETFAAQMEFSPASYQGEQCIQVIIRSDSQNAALEEKLREISRRDMTTGLYNRSHFLNLLGTAASACENKDVPSALGYLRIDHYSGMLTNIGLSGMEKLVTALAELLRAHFDSGEVALARISDNAFALLQTGVTAAPLENPLQKLLKDVASRLFDIGGRTIQCTLSIGLVGLENGACQAAPSLERARQCAGALAPQGNGLKRYDAQEELAARAGSGDTVALLKQALASDGFRLLFQPVVSLRGSLDENYEVLLRLATPQGEEIPPSEFLAVAEQAGLLGKIDRWVVINAIKSLRSSQGSACLFVHLSAASLKDDSLLPWLASILKAAKLPAGRLIFQFSSKEAESWIAQAKTLIRGLGALQCKTALSQFDGSARQFALLSHLNTPFIKLGSSLSQHLDEPANQEKLKELLARLREQDKLTLVPFVETVGMLSVLWQAGADYIQGYYLQAPNASMDYDFAAS